ncbi:MAG TPA: hypothetical protein VE379_09400 [Vicinamibacterales bacterium]|jgi:hypothetical protein|nr:hypothetical protein [Vicinamibacterales bacterium]
MRHPSFVASAASALLLAGTAAAEEQDRDRPGPPAIEAVASIASSSSAPADPFVFLDVAATFPLGRGFGAIVRPYAHRLAGGDWEAEMYQLQLRYQSRTRVPVRVDAGIITSPLGLGTLELRPDLSAAIKAPFYYHSPLPAFDAAAPRVLLMSGGYPLGALVSLSGSRWDARGGVTDSSPARPRNVLARDAPPALRQVLAGGGVTPVAGLRAGVGLAYGAYAPAGGSTVANGTYEGELADAEAIGPHASPSPLQAMVFAIEGEYAFGHTRLSGEWVRNRFEGASGNAVARGYFVQAVQTLTPRIFASVRTVGASAPVAPGGGGARKTMTTTEVTAGYRLGRTLALRAGYFTSRRFEAGRRTHTALASVVWAQRWF